MTEDSKKRDLAAAGELAPADQPVEPRSWRSSPWTLAAGAVLAVGALIRILYLTLPPLHHDEGVNGNFLVILYRSGFYHYDPANYHGPSLYYFAWLFARIGWLFTFHDGLTTWAIRLVPAVFGIALVWLVFPLRRYLGDAGTLGASVLVALSPGAVYFSRYFIHEILFVFFSLGIVVSTLYYVRTFRRVYLMLLSASVALLVATKETSVITLAVMVLAYFCTAVFERVRAWMAAPTPEPPKKGRAVEARAARVEQGSPGLVLNPGTGLSRWRQGVGDQKRWLRDVLWAAALFIVIHVCLYSSFFTNPEGILDSVLTYETWTQTGVNGYVAARDQYLTWMGRTELGTLLLGSAGLVLAFLRGRNRFGIFVAFYAMGELFAYSLIPYKTPWLVLNILLPFWLAGGCAVQEIAEAVRDSRLQRDRVAAWAGAILVVVGTGWQSVDLSYFRYDDNSLPYVYAHTRRSFLEMTDEIDKVVELNHLGKGVGITVMAPEHWPLPWYTRNYPNTGYWSKVVPTTEAIIVGQDHQREAIALQVGGAYERVGTYDMRPGVILDLYVRIGLAH